MQEPKYITVSALNRYIAYKFDSDTNLQEVYLKGEISNFKFSGKHCYFSLKDANSEISAMFFYPDNLSLKFDPKDGMNVLVVGKVQTYLKKGTYAIIVKQMIADGIGLLYQEYLDLKDKLSKEGLFDESRKIPLPAYPEVVAVITAPTGDAIHDIISTFNRRLPLAKIKLYPALVQGADAPKDLMRALREVYQDEEVDALIIGRGGGSFEDLSCFNNEALVRLLASSKIPTVSAIGHEADFTICDFVSSYRSPTPTGAAIALTKERRDVLETLGSLNLRIKNATKTKLINCYNDLKKLNSSYGIARFDELISGFEKTHEGFHRHLTILSPENLMLKMKEDLNDYRKRQEIAFSNAIDRFSSMIISDELLLKGYSNVLINYEKQIYNMIDKMEILNPFSIMKKGYGILYVDGKIVSSTGNIKKDDEIVVRLSDGKIIANVKKIEEV